MAQYLPALRLGNPIFSLHALSALLTVRGGHAPGNWTLSLVPKLQDAIVAAHLMSYMVHVAPERPEAVTPVQCSQFCNAFVLLMRTPTSHSDSLTALVLL